MKVKNKKTRYALLFTACCLAGYFFWLSLHPVEIIAVHHRVNSSTAVLVKNFPFTDKGKISWWMENRDMLKEKYNIPRPKKSGIFEVIFWDFGEGYVEDDGVDRLCFDDVNPPLNCIEKDKVFTVSNYRDKDMEFVVQDGEYHINEQGKLVKTKY